MDKLRFFMERLGFKYEDIYKIIRDYSLEGYTEVTLINNIMEIYKYLINNNFNMTEIINLTKKWPKLIRCNKELIQTKINYLLLLGISQSDIKNTILKFPSVLNLSINNIDAKISELLFIGFTREKIVKMISVSPQLIGLKIENIIERINYLNESNYSLEEIINIASEYPAIFCIGIDSFKSKVEFYKEIGINDLMARCPKNFMSSLNLSYARYKYLLNNDMLKSKEDYRKLFWGNSIFYNKYKVTKEELLNVYSLNLDDNFIITRK